MRVRAPGAAGAACAERGPQGDSPGGPLCVLGRGPLVGRRLQASHRPACGAARPRLAQGMRHERYARGSRARSGNLPPCGALSAL